MKLPLSLIKSFINIDLPVQKISEILTLLGIEVDRIHNEYPSFVNVIIAEVVSARPHPSSDKLKIAEVSDGSHRYTVVCAAANCRAGIKTAFAKPGALLTDLDGLQRKIEKSSLRGVESEGMLCSASELHLFDEPDQILELPKELETGKDLASLLWDPVFEISLTPNLGHCMSALGIARELSASLQKPIHHPKTVLVENPKIPIEDQIDVAIHDFKLCPRYMCRLIEGVKIGPSPFWLKLQLENCGLKSINNAVDIANFIMIKYGQPLHAFDFNKIEGKTIHVAASEKTQAFHGLDEIKREIPPGTLLISDTHKPIAIAGVLGGANSAVSTDTTAILLEAAYFDPMTVRIGSKKTGVRTESSQRFEKGIDPAGIKEALDAACRLLLDVCHGTLAKGVIDEKKHPLAPKEIFCRTERINQLLGTKISQTEIEEIFQRLDFKTQSVGNGKLRVEVPLYRSDVNEEIDLVEEAARIYGYNNIEKKSPLCTNSQIPHDPAYLFEKECRNRLVALGLQEFLNCDLISPKLADISSEIKAPQIAFLQTLHSKSEEYSILRASLLPGLLQVAKGNIDQKNQTIHAFEMGRIHFLQKEKVIEIPMAAILLTGREKPSNWSQKSKEADFFDLKGILENLLDSLNVKGCIFQPSQHISFHPGRQANLFVDGLIVGSFGEVHPSLLEKFDIKQRVIYAELNLDDLAARKKSNVRMSPIPLFPASDRDWTIPLPLDMPIQSIFDGIHSLGSHLLEKVDLIDLYTPENGTQKNATFRFIYRDKLKTISFEDVEAEHAKLLSQVSKLLAK